jgi:hypothetical protein
VRAADRVWIIHRLPRALGALIALMCIAACGSETSSGVVARVGAAPITRSELDHWTTALMGGSGSPASDRSAEATRQRALAYLISARWLLGEATRLGAAPSRPQIHERVEERVRRSFPGGQSELREFLKATGQAVSDLELEASAELAASRLAALARANVSPPTPAQILAYYQAHSQAFTVPEVIEVALTDRKTPATAAELLAAVRAGRSFATFSRRLIVERPPGMTAANAPEPLARAIYAARPHVLTGPVRQGPDYTVFEIKRTVPPRRQTLRQVSATIRRQLHASSLRHALAAAVGAWRARWTERTSCGPGYVVQKCRQYRGPKIPEAPLEFN